MDGTEEAKKKKKVFLLISQGHLEGRRVQRAPGLMAAPISRIAGKELEATLNKKMLRLILHRWRGASLWLIPAKMNSGQVHMQIWSSGWGSLQLS